MHLFLPSLGHSLRYPHRATLELRLGRDRIYAGTLALLALRRKPVLLAALLLCGALAVTLGSSTLYAPTVPMITPRPSLHGAER